MGARYLHIRHNGSSAVSAIRGHVSSRQVTKFEIEIMAKKKKKKATRIQYKPSNNYQYAISTPKDSAFSWISP